MPPLLTCSNRYADNLEGVGPYAPCTGHNSSALCPCPFEHCTLHSAPPSLAGPPAPPRCGHAPSSPAKLTRRISPPPEDRRGLMQQLRVIDGAWLGGSGVDGASASLARGVHTSSSSTAARLTAWLAARAGGSASLSASSEPRVIGCDSIARKLCRAGTSTPLLVCSCARAPSLSLRPSAAWHILVLQGSDLGTLRNRQTIQNQCHQVDNNPKKFLALGKGLELDARPVLLCSCDSCRPWHAGTSPGRALFQGCDSAWTVWLLIRPPHLLLIVGVIDDPRTKP